MKVEYNKITKIYFNKSRGWTIPKINVLLKKFPERKILSTKLLYIAKFNDKKSNMDFVVKSGDKLTGIKIFLNKTLIPKDLNEYRVNAINNTEEFTAKMKVVNNTMDKLSIFSKPIEKNMKVAKTAKKLKGKSISEAHTIVKKDDPIDLREARKGKK